LRVVNIFDPLFLPTTVDTFRDHIQPRIDLAPGNLQLQETRNRSCPFRGEKDSFVCKALRFIFLWPRRSEPTPLSLRPIPAYTI
jgi:hypothetical protein